MSKSKKQLKKDLKYLKKHLDDNKEINQIIKHMKKLGFHPHNIFVKSLYSFLMEKHQKNVQDSTMLSILTLQNSTIIIG